MSATTDPKNKTTPNPQDWAQAMHETRNRLMKDKPRAFPSGTKRKCPVCQRRTLESRDDLMRETTVGSIVLIHHNLHGARCTQCATEFLEAFEEITLEENGPERILTDYQAKVTSVSGRNLGTYWPKDVVRMMDLHNQDGLRVQILDSDTMVIRREHDHE